MYPISVNQWADCIKLATVRDPQKFFWPAFSVRQCCRHENMSFWTYLKCLKDNSIKWDNSSRRSATTSVNKSTNRRHFYKPQSIINFVPFCLFFWSSASSDFPMKMCSVDCVAMCLSSDQTINFSFFLLFSGAKFIKILDINFMWQT